MIHNMIANRVIKYTHKTGLQLASAGPNQSYNGYVKMTIPKQISINKFVKYINYDILHTSKNITDIAAALKMSPEESSEGLGPFSGIQLSYLDDIYLLLQHHYQPPSARGTLVRSSCKPEDLHEKIESLLGIMSICDKDIIWLNDLVGRHPKIS